MNIDLNEEGYRLQGERNLTYSLSEAILKLKLPNLVLYQFNKKILAEQKSETSPELQTISTMLLDLGGFVKSFGTILF